MPPPEHLPATFILHASWEMIDMIVAKKEFKIHWLAAGAAVFSSFLTFAATSRFCYAPSPKRLQMVSN